MIKRTYYGQSGEDSILWSLFENKESGFFLDVGALDGLRFSNTYAFEKAGWKGICIEGHPFYAKLTKKNRPNSIVIHAAAGSTDKKEITFYTNLLGSLSTINPQLEDYYKRAYKKAFRGFKPVQVKMRTVNSILEQYNIDHIDAVSIDVDGTEADVIKGFNLQKYKPKVLVIEAMTKEMENKLKAVMKSKKYVFARKVSNNYFFCDTVKNAKIISNAKNVPRNTLVHTDHPLKGKQ